MCLKEKYGKWRASGGAVCIVCIGLCLYFCSRQWAWEEKVRKWEWDVAVAGEDVTGLDSQLTAEASCGIQIDA